MSFVHLVPEVAGHLHLVSPEDVLLCHEPGHQPPDLLIRPLSQPRTRHRHWIILTQITLEVIIIIIIIITLDGDCLGDWELALEPRDSFLSASCSLICSVSMADLRPVISLS